MPNDLALFEAVAADVETIRGKIIVTMEGQDFQRDLGFYGLSINSSEADIIGAIAPMIQEQFGENIRGTYKVRKALANENVYVIPNSTAG